MTKRWSRRYECPDCGMSGRLPKEKTYVREQTCRQCGHGFLLNEIGVAQTEKGTETPRRNVCEAVAEYYI